MKKTFMKTFVCLLVVWSLTVFTFAAPTPPGQTQGDNLGQVKKELRDHFRGLTDQGLFSGSVLVAKDDRVLYKEGLGVADYDTGQVNTPTTVYAIASMSKAFTAMSIMMLEERGLLSVNDKLSDYFPDYPYGDDITIHQLLNMSAGIPDFFTNIIASGNFSNYHTPEEMLQYFVDDPLVHEPGNGWAYCNSCFMFLGMIIEQVSGLTYRDFLQENIFDPLKMKHTSYEPNDLDFANKRAVGYDHIDVLPPPVSPYLNAGVAYSAGGVFSTVTDMYKWHRALETEQLLSAETLRKIFTPGLGNYGYGWYIEYHDISGQERKLVWHWGSYLGYHGFIGRFVEDDVFIMLLLNFT
ncbi:MAG: beta-lactamase family protein, partial [bacterium]|nr:beta-lactamase family protein [bacterium]